ncbi:unnamed protein product [Arctogadus glacialis]
MAGLCSGARSPPHLSNISSSPPASTMKEPTLLAVMACDPAVHWGLCDMGHTERGPAWYHEPLEAVCERLFGTVGPVLGLWAPSEVLLGWFFREPGPRCLWRPSWDQEKPSTIPNALSEALSEDSEALTV